MGAKTCNLNMGMRCHCGEVHYAYLRLAGSGDVLNLSRICSARSAREDMESRTACVNKCIPLREIRPMCESP